MRVVPLASSSQGNAYLVEHEGAVLLIDCGISYLELRKRMKAKTVKTGQTLFDKFEGVEITAADIDAVLITHSHGDHTKGLETFLKRNPETPVYANTMTAEKIISEMKLPEESFVCFENGQEFCVGPFSINAFSIPHDTADPVGYMVKVAGEGESSDPICSAAQSLSCSSAFCYFHGTDIGTPLDSIGVKLREADIATLESNHDPVMLRTSGRAPCLIQRIAGPRGHLSNDQSAQLVAKFATPRLKKLMLAHLSQDCNSPNLALSTMREALSAIGRADVEVEVLSP